MYYVTYYDDVHDGIADEYSSLFEATCALYELIPQLDSDEWGELGEFLGDDNEQMDGFLYSNPKDRV